MIAAGDHREAMFWISVTHARCMKVLEADGSPDQREVAQRGLRDALGDLGIASGDEMQRRLRAIEEALPALLRLAGRIIDANPAIRPRGEGDGGKDQTISTRVP
jgi:hypothetical protein